MKEYWSRILAFNSQFFPHWRKIPSIYYSNALAGEVGELCNAVKHLAGGGTHHTKPSLEQLAEELADAFIYLVLLAESLAINYDNFEVGFDFKMQKNRERMEEKP